MHFMRHLFQYISTATRPQMLADNLDWILFWEWCTYDTLAGGTMGMTDGPGGPVIIGDPRSPGDMHAEGMLFVRAGYEGPEDVHPNAQPGWAALNFLLLSFGALDSAYTQNQTPSTTQASLRAWQPDCQATRHTRMRRSGGRSIWMRTMVGPGRWVSYRRNGCAPWRRRSCSHTTLTAKKGHLGRGPPNHRLFFAF